MTAHDKLADIEHGLRALLLDDQPRYLEGVPRRPQDVYRRLVRNTLQGTMLNAAPIARGIFGDEVLLRFITRALQERPPTTRLLRDVPMEFASWLLALDEQGALFPPHPAFAELVHWEAAEIDILHAPERSATTLALVPTDASTVELDPSARLLVYAHDVHRMKAGDAMPTAKRARPALLLAWRADERLKWRELDGVTARMIALAGGGLPVSAITTTLAAERGSPVDPGFVRATLTTWQGRGAIAGFVDGGDR